MPEKLPTIKEIARQLGISPSAVSRALHNHPSIGAKTRQRVQELAKALDYEPIQTALNFKQGKTQTIGVILPHLGEEFFSRAISGIEDIAFKNGYTVLIGQSREDGLREQQMVATMKKHRIDGLIVSIAKTTANYSHFEELRKYNIPVVFFDRIPRMNDINFVCCDLRAGTEAAVALLTGQGHRRIAFLNGPETLIASGERYEGYRTALSRHGIPLNPDLVKTTDLSSASTEKAVSELLSAGERPESILSFNDYVSLDAIHYIKKQGLVLNRDIAIVSFANISFNHYLDAYPLASVEQFPDEQGEKAMQLLLDLLSGKPPPLSRQLIIESKLVLHS